MRYGQNPAKFMQEVAHPRPVTVCIVTYIPFLEGYYTQSLDVLKVCLGSLLAHTQGSYDLLVFDNASCPEVISYLNELKAAGKIQYLILSDKNVGKVGAWNVMFGGGLGEYLVYADSDVYFYPGWLEKHLEVLRTFPEAATVSGVPRRGTRAFYDHTLELIGRLPDAVVEEGQFIPPQWIGEHLRSLGKEMDVQAELDQTDFRVTRQGVSAYASADHFEFMALSKTLRQYLPLPYDRPMGDSVHNLDRLINGSDMIRLAVSERVVRHLGNTLDEQTLAELPDSLRSGVEAPRQSRPSGKLYSFVDWRPVKSVLLRIYDHIFRLYFRRGNQE